MGLMAIEKTIKFFKHIIWVINYRFVSNDWLIDAINLGLYPYTENHDEMVSRITSEHPEIEFIIINFNVYNRSDKNRFYHVYCPHNDRYYETIGKAVQSVYMELYGFEATNKILQK